MFCSAILKSQTVTRHSGHEAWHSNSIFSESFAVFLEYCTDIHFTFFCTTNTAPLEILLLFLEENEIYALNDSLNWRKNLTLGLPFMLQYDAMQMRIQYHPIAFIIRSQIVFVLRSLPC